LAGEHLTVIVNGATYSDVAVTAGHWSLDTASAHTGTLGAFTHGQSYDVIATVTDGAGNSTSDSSNNEITFDDQAPTLTSSTPGNGDIRVRAEHNLTFTFSEDIAVGAGFITLVDVTDSTNNIQIDVTDTSQVSIQGGVLTLNPTDNLGYGDDYELLIDAGAIQDLAGNSYAGITNTNSLDFKTSIAGQAVISSAEMGGTPFAYLGYANSQLIAPLMVEDKIYYVLDLNHDNMQDFQDDMHLDDLSQTFFGINNGTQFTESNRTWAVNEYFNALLPTVGAPITGQRTSFTATDWSNTTAGWDTDPNSNSIYNDLLAIWDAFNGNSTAPNAQGWPPGWISFLNGALSSNPDTSNIGGNYYNINSFGTANADSTGSTYSVVLQVL
jgi:hypothetical protein